MTVPGCSATVSSTCGKHWFGNKIFSFVLLKVMHLWRFSFIFFCSSSGDLVSVPGAISLRLMFRVPVLLGLSVWSVLWLVPYHKHVHAALQHQPCALPRTTGRRAPPAAQPPALHTVWGVQRLQGLHTGTYDGQMAYYERVYCCFIKGDI